MKLLFIHDHPFYVRTNNEVYSGGGLPSTTWIKYLVNFDNIIVFGRKSSSENSNKVKSSYTNVGFHLTTNYTSIKMLLFNYKKLYKELSELIDRVDIVLIRLPSVLGIIAGFIALKKKKNIWIEQVGNALEAGYTHGSLLAKVNAPISHFLNKKLVKNVSFVSYVTQNKLQRDYPANYKSITMAVSNVTIKEILKEEDLINDRYYSEKIKIGLLGGFDVKYKGQDILLKAVNLLPDYIKENIELHFAGKGNYQWILNLANILGLQKNIIFIGSLKAGNEVNNFLEKMSLYIQPSLTEGMPRATIEAMAMGCPVIGSNVGGIPDIVNEEFVHKKASEKQLSEHIKRLFENRELLFKEAKLSLKKAKPYLKKNLDQKREIFYQQMNVFLHENK